MSYWSGDAKWLLASRCRQLALTSLLSASGLAPEVGHPQLLRSAEAVAAIVSTISVMNAEATATEECLYSLVAISEACGWAEGAHGVEQEIAALVTQATPAVLACLDADNEQIVMAATSAVAHMAGLEKLPGRTAWVASVRAHANARFLGESLLQLLNRSQPPHFFIVWEALGPLESFETKCSRCNTDSIEVSSIPVQVARPCHGASVATRCFRPAGTRAWRTCWGSSWFGVQRQQV